MFSKNKFSTIREEASVIDPLLEKDITHDSDTKCGTIANSVRSIVEGSKEKRGKCTENEVASGESVLPEKQTTLLTALKEASGKINLSH